jgi:IS1 family transposase
MESCKMLWARISERFGYQVSFSDLWEAYHFIFQQTGQHQKVGKESGQTNHMERGNNTIRQWVGRLTRKTLSCSKSDFFNELVIRFFIVRYNLSKSV